MTEYRYELKIPKERVAVLIGKAGSMKKELETSTKTKLDIDSEEGDVFVKGEEALGLFLAREIIQAIGRGFNPEIALLLTKPDYVLEVIDIKEFIGTSKDSGIRLKGRVIGREGKSRKLIEELSECYVSVFGKTIAIIGTADHALIAKQAVESLLKGSTHANVYKFLERKRRDIKRNEVLGNV
ncbi:MAG TPA: KH domain-containing protein [Candidatus Nanoarchaeia archaeon]|nr:KH domain-containing protein [Candidatus Nanoarchaeia archaeon]